MPNSVDVKDASGATVTIATNDYLADLLAAASRANSSALEASRVVKNAAGKLFALFGYNSHTAAIFIQIHDAASLPADSAVPVMFFKVSAGQHFSFTVPIACGLPCSTGIVVCSSSTGPTKTISGSTAWFCAVYK